MPSSYSTRNRIIKQATGEGANVWGDLQSSGDFDMIDFALDGWTIKALTADVTLTTANGTTDEARARCLKFTGTGSYTVTIPSLEKNYLVWNATTGTLTVTTGAGATAVLLTGEIVPIICDASAVKRLTALTMSAARLQDVADPTGNQDAATKKYVDDTAFTANAGVLPGQPGNAGKFLTTDGTVASWGSDFSTVAAAASDIRTGTNNTKPTTVAALANSAAFGTLTDAATVAWEIATQGYNATVTLGGNRIIGAPTLSGASLYDGLSVCLELVQDATGSRVPTWNSIWDWGTAGTPALQTGAGKRDLVFGIYRSATSKIHANFRRGA